VVILKEEHMKRLDYPFSHEAVRELKVGDMVLITGKLFTGRDADVPDRKNKWCKLSGFFVQGN
jgi:tartrate dehydratase beta subunit/fumarate hydratase class I family protein